MARVPESSVSRGSAALLDALLALAPADAVRALSVATDEGGRGAEAMAVLIGRDWRRLLEHVQGADAMFPAALAWRAAAALYHLGHLVDAVRVVSRAETAGAADVDRSRLAGVTAAVAWSRGEGERCRELVATALKHAQVSGDAAAESSAWVLRAMLANRDRTSVV